MKRLLVELEAYVYYLPLSNIVVAYPPAPTCRAWYGMERKFQYGIWKMPEWNGMEWKISRMEWKTIFHTSIPIPY